MTEEQIKYMVNRFLCWRLPNNFNPDCGISFDRKYQDDHSPIGTNVFDAVQADAMVRHMIDGMPFCDGPSFREIKDQVDPAASQIMKDCSSLP